MKNIQVRDGALNATLSTFQATDEFCEIFPGPGRDLEIVEEYIARVGEEAAGATLNSLWQRPIAKGEVHGLHGTLFYDYEEHAQFCRLRAGRWIGPGRS